MISVNRIIRSIVLCRRRQLLKKWYKAKCNVETWENFPYDWNLYPYYSSMAFKLHTKAVEDAYRFEKELSYRSTPK